MYTLLVKIFITILFVLLLQGCAYVEKSGKHGYGPPPHAPAHGYRYKHQQGVELVYDADLGVYIVIGCPGCYFYDNYFYRYIDDAWRLSLRIDGPWIDVKESELPPGLQKMKAKGNKKKDHPGKGYGPPGWDK